MKNEMAVARQYEVLLVEDNPADAKLIQDALQGSQHPVHVTVARTAESALDFLRKRDPHSALPPFNFILLDLGLPGRNGWEFLSTLKGDPFLKNIPVLILTGSQDQHDLMRAQFSMADDFLNKPFDLAHLGALVGYLEENWFKKKEQPPLSANRPFPSP